MILALKFTLEIYLEEINLPIIGGLHYIFLAIIIVLASIIESEAINMIINRIKVGLGLRGSERD